MSKKNKEDLGALMSVRFYMTPAKKKRIQKALLDKEISSRDFVMQCFDNLLKNKK